MTFVSGRPCKSTRDDYLSRRGELSEHDVLQLSLLHPILIAGPGAQSANISDQKLAKIEADGRALIERLHKVPYSKYRNAMQAIRLAHLSLINKREDFGLAYLLIVSAIEAIAQKAISRNSVKSREADKKEWKEKAERDPEFKSLLALYKEIQGGKNYLKERFIKFILKYSPVQHWENCTPHPFQDWHDEIKTVSGGDGFDHLLKKHWFEKYPHELEPGEIDNILGDAYKHRSCFVHSGEQPPHRDPQSAFNRFFQEERIFKGDRYEEKLLPNYELLFGLAQRSIIEWMNEG